MYVSQEVVEYSGGHAHIQTAYGTEGELSYADELWAAGNAEGLMAWQDAETGKYGYVDEGWNWVIAPVFRSAERFRDGYAVVRLETDAGAAEEWGVIQKP